MLNSSTVRGRQTQMSSRRGVGANLVPTLVRLAECTDLDVAHPARAVVLAIYGDKLDPSTILALGRLSSDEIETMLDVMSLRRLDLATAPGYLTLYLGSIATFGTDATFPLAGMGALAALRDDDPANGTADIAGRVLRLDLLDRLSPAARSFLSESSMATLRGLCDEVAQHDVPDTMLVCMVEAVCN